MYRAFSATEPQSTLHYIQSSTHLPLLVVSYIVAALWQNTYTDTTRVLWSPPVARRVNCPLFTGRTPTSWAMVSTLLCAWSTILTASMHKGLVPNSNSQSVLHRNQKDKQNSHASSKAINCLICNPMPLDCIQRETRQAQDEHTNSRLKEFDHG